MNINKHLQLFIIIISILFIGIFVFFFQNFSISQPTTKAQSSYVPIGEGCTNAYYIDKDCDGYGVASPNGPDADDNDPEVNTPETVIAKYKNLTNFLHHLGYNPDRIFYIATNGNDDTGEVNNINKPYKTWNAVKPQLQPGDAVIFRGGTYIREESISKWGFPDKLSGEENAPIIFMVYPGEKVVIDGKINFRESSWLIFDGFIIDNFVDQWGDGVKGAVSHNIIIRNIESRGHASGCHIMYDLHNILIEDCVFHDNPNSHGIYLGALEDPNSNLTVRNCIMYHNGRHGFQHNGRVENLVVENCIMHSNNLGGISLLQGVRKSVFRNNLVFNNNKQGIIFYLYPSKNYCFPYDQFNNLFVNNLIWVGKYKWKGNGIEPSNHAAVQFNDATGNHSMDGNVFRNNILIAYNGPVFRFDQKKFADTTTIENNVIYRVGGSNEVMTYGGDTYDFDTFQNFSNLIKNNVFQDPKFTDVSIDYNLTPEKFNFDYLSDSPAIDFGITTDNTPLTDLRGNSRVGNPDAGCYEYLPQNLTILTSALPEGIVNQSYSATIQSFGGTPPYTYSIISGNLPSDLNLSSDGVISGKPTQSGSYNFTIKVTDSSNNEDTKEFTLIVNDEQTQPLTITTESLPEGTVNVEYSATLSASGGTTPYTWSKISGNLPNGLSLNSSTGIISGTPTTQGTFNFTVQVKDNENNTATKSLSITINPPDTTPPTRSNGSPTGELPAGTNQITLSLTTNENATCRYSTTPNIPYTSMTNTFSNTGSTSHSTTITGLSSSNTYNYYIKCIDTSGNANTDDYTISFSIASPGEITTVVSKIKPDCTGESGLCFTSLAAWEEARQGDITASGRNTIEIAECYPMVDTTPVVIDGWKTDANHYIKIYTPETARHNSTVRQGFKIKANAHWIDVIEIADIGNDGCIYIEGLIIDVGTYAANGLALNVSSDKSCSAYFSKNIIYSSDPSNSHSNAKGIVVGESGYYGHLYAWDNLIYDIQNGIGMKFNSWNPAHAYNNTVYNCNIGIDAGGGSSNDLLKNNLCNGNNTDYSGTFSSNSVNNISEDDTSPNADYRNKAVSFVDEANDDFHLAPDDICAKGSGIDLSSDPDLSFTDDIDGDTRSGTWDIGADERSESTFLVGDLNQDNKVDSQDFQILIQKFRQTQDIGKEDLNSDGIVDAKDIGIMMHHWTN